MLVKCLHNDVRSIDPGSDLRRELDRSYGTDTHALDLTVGGLYVVYGVLLKGGWTQFFVADDAYPSTGYPVAYHAAFFEVVDGRVSQYWSFTSRDLATQSAEVLLVFDAWSTESTFYERLVEGDDRQRQLFRERKELMDLEYPNPSVSDTAELLGDSWLQCPRCGESWDSALARGLVRCPKCFAVLVNPLSP